jgi:toluene monooxygenase system protein D
MMGQGPDIVDEDMVGPVIRAGALADAVAAAAEDDNPGADVHVIERGDYVRIHIDRQLRLTRASIENYLGKSFSLAQLEAEMPSFKGRMEGNVDEVRWFYLR